MKLDTATIDALFEEIIDQMDAARLAFPVDDYSARIYFCPSCRTLNGAVAPRADLIDGYPCPVCESASVPWVDAAP